MLSLCGIPEDEDLKPRSSASSPTTVPTAIPRDVEVEVEEAPPYGSRATSGLGSPDPELASAEAGYLSALEN